jgi:hypothetical protein
MEVGMLFNDREIPDNLFELENDKLNPQGLYNYAKDIEEHLGVKYIFVEYADGSQPETAEYFPDENEVHIPACFIKENLTEKEYRAAKGIIDHETGHIRWPDRSYLTDNNEDDEDREIIYDIGNFIDDMRIERRMVNEFQVDRNNFKYMYEFLHGNNTELDIPDMAQDLFTWFYWFVNEEYRGVDLSFLGNRKTPGKIFFLMPNLMAIVDRLIACDGEAREGAREILQLLRHESKKIVKIIKKNNDNDFEVTIDGQQAWLSISSEFQCNFKEGDEIPMENVITNYYITYLQTIPRGAK